MQKTMNLFISSGRGRKGNTSYPFSAPITSLDALKEAAQYDHVCAEYADGKNNKGRLIKAYRSKKTFVASNCLPMDCDNTNPNPLLPDIPESEWKTPADVAAAFQGVPFYVVYSQNHMKAKDRATPRPRFHVYFPMDEVNNIEYYEKLKQEVLRRFPAFDDNAVDGARFFFGVEDPKVEYVAGDTLINDFIFRSTSLPENIPSGARNATLLSYSGKVLKRFGDTDKAYDMFLAAAERCDDPLDASELKSIWQNAVDFFHNTVEVDPKYVPAEAFGLTEFKATDSGKVTSDDIRMALTQMGITVRLNVITGQVDISGMPAQFSKSNAPNTLPTLLQDYFSKRDIHVTRQVIDDSLVLIEDENRFNPVEDMLKSTKWDKKDRISVLCEILGINKEAKMQDATKSDAESAGRQGNTIADDIVVAPSSVGNDLLKSILAQPGERNELRIRIFDNIADPSSVVGDEHSVEPGAVSTGASDEGCRDEKDGDVIDAGTEERKAWNPEAVFLTKWLHQCIAMALNDDEHPYGADGVLVLQAQQGAGKTFFCRKIAMNSDLFAEGVSIDLDNKDSIIQGTGVWISELGELDSTLKREQSALKAFITSPKDTYRQPYAKVAVSKPRRTSFCATVNPKEFLNDETGSRRFWVIQPGQIDVQKLKELDELWLRQLWAQVYEELYLPSPQGFRLSEEERTWLQKNNEQYEKPLPGELEILERLCWHVPVEHWRWKKTSQIIEELPESVKLN